MVENVVTWRKASRSDNGGNCVEVAFGPDGRATGMVRDSKRPHDGNLAVSVDAFAAFLASVKAGRFELGRLGPSGI